LGLQNKDQIDDDHPKPDHPAFYVNTIKEEDDLLLHLDGKNCLRYKNASSDALASD